MPEFEPVYRTSGARRVFLTFDDGPHPSRTPMVLEALEKHNVQALFFVIGQNVAAHPGTVQQAAAAGHWIGNHSYTHPTMSRLSNDRVREEVERTNALIQRHAGSKVFRFPYGAHNRRVDQVITGMGYELMFWNVDPMDWKYRDDLWVNMAIDQIEDRDEALVVMHDIHTSTASRVDMLIQRIKGLGDVVFPPLQELVDPPLSDVPVG